MWQFAQESAVFPLVHAVTPLAFYMCTRNFLLSITAMYVWEQMELLLSGAFASLAETCSDSLVGDPIIGFFGMLPFVLLDWVTGFDVVFRRHANVWLRVLAFVGIGIATLIPVHLETSTVYWGIAVFIPTYILVALLAFKDLVFYTGPNAEVQYAGISVIIWLIAVLTHGIVALIKTPADSLYSSSWMRTFLLSLIFLLSTVPVLHFADRRRREHHQ